VSSARTPLSGTTSDPWATLRAGRWWQVGGPLTYPRPEIRRRARDAGIRTQIGNHTFRATGITAYLSNGDTLDHAQQIAVHESPRTT